MDTTNISQGTSDSPGNDREEELRMENELLQMKIMAEFGGEMEEMVNVPPEVTNQFLKNVISFEQQYASSKPEKVISILGNPVFKKACELDDRTFTQEWNRLNRLLEEKSLVVDFIRPRDERFQYRFITEELFEYETDGGITIPGMTCHFTYEEFHQDHEMDITNRAEEFLSRWLEQDISADDWYLNKEFIQPNGKVITSEELMEKLRSVFDSYKAFENGEYIIQDVKVQLNEEESVPKMGYAEGSISYDGILESGERKHIEGPFKLYLACEYEWWNIFFFYLPGFNVSKRE